VNGVNIGKICIPQQGLFYSYSSRLRSTNSFERSRRAHRAVHSDVSRAETKGVPRAKPRGTYIYRLFVSASLDEQFESSRVLTERRLRVYPERRLNVYPERSRGVHIYTDYSSRLRSTNSSERSSTSGL